MTSAATHQPTQPSSLNQPLRLPSGIVLPNRLAKSAMSEALATYDNHPTQELVALYRRWAESGIGLLITGNVMVDRRALGEPGKVVIEEMMNNFVFDHVFYTGSTLVGKIIYKMAKKKVNDEIDLLQIIYLAQALESRLMMI